MTVTDTEVFNPFKPDIEPVEHAAWEKGRAITAPNPAVSSMPTPDELVRELQPLNQDAQLRRIHEIIVDLAGGGELQRQRYRNAVVNAKFMRASDWASMVREAKQQSRERQQERIKQERDAIDVAQPACPYVDIDGRTFLLNDEGQPFLLAEFVPKVVAEISRDDGAEVTHHFTIELSTPSGRVAEVETAASHLTRAREWSVRGLGATARILPMSRDEAHVATAAQYFGAGEWVSTTKYVHTGWRYLDGQHRFLTTSGALGETDLDESVAVDLDNERLNGYRLPDPETVTADELVAAVRASVGLLDVAPDSTTALMLGAAYQAPLPLQPETSVFIVGPSGSMKSVVAALACQHFGAAFDYKALPAEWKSTGNSLEAIAYQLADVLFLVDDYAPQSVDDPRKLAATADRLLRGAANASGRSRLRKDGTFAPQRHPRAQILATGEDVPPGESLRARLTIATLKPGTVNMAVLDAAQAAGSAGQYAVAMAGYVQWLAGRRNRGEDLPAQVRQRIAKYRTELSTGVGHLRAPGAAASMLTAWRLWLEYAVTVGAFTHDEATATMRRVRAAIVESVVEQAEHTKQMRVEQVYINGIAAALAAGKVHLADRMTLSEPGGNLNPAEWGWAPYDGPEMTVQWRPKGSLIGWVDHDPMNVYLHPDVAYETAVEHARRQQLALNASKTSIYQHLEQADALESVTRDRKTGEVKQATVTKRVGGKAMKVLHLRAALLTGEQPSSDDGAEDAA